jgi:hypothetical protein
MSEPRFSMYGWDGPGFGPKLSLADLLAIQAEDGTLWAHAEDSGSESCYCEVARWNHVEVQWERFAHCKMMDYRLSDLPEASDEATATEAARRINKPLWFDDRAPVVHSLPNWTGAQ